MGATPGPVWRDQRDASVGMGAVSVVVVLSFRAWAEIWYRDCISRLDSGVWCALSAQQVLCTLGADSAFDFSKRQQRLSKRNCVTEVVVKKIGQSREKNIAGTTVRTAAKIFPLNQFGCTQSLWISVWICFPEIYQIRQYIDCVRKWTRQTKQIVSKSGIFGIFTFCD